jgi:multicomponent Na+:H+ antiporter subunit F
MVDVLVHTAAVLAAAALLLALYRFIKGPTALDRVIAFDGLTIVTITAIVLGALAEGRGIYLDVALVYALLSFLGVIVVARFLEGGF